MRSRSVAAFDGGNTPLRKKSTVPFFIKINKTTTTKSPIFKNKEDKVLEVDLQDDNIEELYELEQMRYTQSKMIELPPNKMTATKNKNFIAKRPLNDNFILSKLSKAKTYYKSVQSKMKNPEMLKSLKKFRRKSTNE